MWNLGFAMDYGTSSHTVYVGFYLVFLHFPYQIFLWSLVTKNLVGMFQGLKLCI